MLRGVRINRWLWGLEALGSANGNIVYKSSAFKADKKANSDIKDYAGFEGTLANPMANVCLLYNIPSQKS